MATHDLKLLPVASQWQSDPIVGHILRSNVCFAFRNLDQRKPGIARRG